MSDICSFPFLKAKDLMVSFSKKTVLQNISLDIHCNERIAIIGPNGSGKTTLLRALSGRFPTLYQNIFLQGVAFSMCSRAQMAQSIAFVAQNDFIDPRLAVRDYVALGQIPHNRKNRRHTQKQLVEQALQDTEMADFMFRALGTLSGGQMQRVLLARAFAQEPQILMLDEPTNHLDPRARSDILTMVRSRQATVVAVLHDLALVPFFADRVLVMQNGCLVAQGTPEEVLTEEILADVFGMTRFVVAHPKTGKSVMVFEPVSSYK